MSDICFNNDEQFLIESVVETLSGEIAADIADHYRNGEVVRAELKLLTQSRVAALRKMLCDKGLIQRGPVVRPNASRVGTASVRDALMNAPDPLEQLALVIEGAEHAA